MPKRLWIIILFFLFLMVCTYFFYLKIDIEKYFQLRSANRIYQTKKTESEKSSKHAELTPQAIFDFLEEMAAHYHLHIANIRSNKANHNQLWLSAGGTPSHIEEFLSAIMHFEINPLIYHFWFQQEQLQFEVLFEFPILFNPKKKYTQVPLATIFCISPKPKKTSLLQAFSVSDLHWLGWIKAQEQQLLILRLPNQKIISINQQDRIGQEAARWKSSHGKNVVFEDAAGQQFYIPPAQRQKVA